MDIYQEDSYKKNLRARQKELHQSRPALTFKKISKQIPIQYTYLSKIMNDSSSHFSEEQLFTICQLLEFQTEETEYILLQRAHESAQSPARKKFLFAKLESLKKERHLSAKKRDSSTSTIVQDVEYLFDPLAVLIHLALFIESYRKNPRLLCEKLGIREAHLRVILGKLEKLGWLEFDERTWTISHIQEKALHYGRDHPLMRVHQNLLKTNIQSQLMRTPEPEKNSFIATFTTDASGAEKIKEAYNEFIKKVENVVQKSRDHFVYQLNVDLFKWL